MLPPLPGETMVEGNEEDHDEIIEPDIIDMDAKLNLILDFVAARGVKRPFTMMTMVMIIFACTPRQESQE